MKFWQFFSGQAYTPAGESYLIDLPIEHWNGVSFMDTKAVKDWDPRYIAIYPSMPKPTIDLLPCTALIVSKKLRALVERVAPGQAQFLPLRLQQMDGTGEVRGYSLMVLLKSVDCIDRERTPVRDGVWQKDKRGSYKVQGIVRYRQPKTKFHLFRVDGWSVQKMISDALRQAMQDAGIQGGAFREIE